MSKFSVFLMLLFFLVFALLAKNVWDYFTKKGRVEGFATAVSENATTVLKYSNNSKQVYMIFDGGTNTSKIYFDPDNGNVFSFGTNNTTLKVLSREYGTQTTVNISGDFDSGNGLTISKTNMLSYYNDGWVKPIDVGTTVVPYIAYIPFGKNTLIHVFDSTQHIRTRYFDSDGNMFGTTDPTDRTMVGSSTTPAFVSKSITFPNPTPTTTKIVDFSMSNVYLSLSGGDFLSTTPSSKIPTAANFTIALNAASTAITVSGDISWNSVTLNTVATATSNTITIPRREGFTTKKEGFATTDLTTVSVAYYPNKVYKIANEVYVDLLNSYLVLSTTSGTTKVYDNTSLELDATESQSNVTRVKFNAWAVNGISDAVDYFVVYMDNGRKTIVVKVVKVSGDFKIETIKRIEDGVLVTADKSSTTSSDSSSESSSTTSTSSSSSLCGSDSLEVKIAGVSLCVPTSQALTYASAFFGGGMSPGDNFIRKTEVVPPVCPQCPQCPSGNVCSNCGGHGGSGTSDGTGSSLLRDTGSGASNLLRDGAGGADSLIRDAASGAVNTATNAASGITGVAKDTVGGAVGIGRELIGGTVGLAQGAVSGIGSGVYGAATSIGGGLGSIGTGLGNLVTQTNPAIPNNGGGGVNPSYGYGYPGGGYGSNQNAYLNSTGAQVPGIDPYSYYGALSQRPTSNFMPRTADFSTFGK
jgi:hypothetical protein